MGLGVYSGRALIRERSFEEIWYFYYLKAACFTHFPDIDECSRPELNPCDSNALCTNVEGSFVCRCLRGFKGDGLTCTGIYILFN